MNENNVKTNILPSDSELEKIVLGTLIMTSSLYPKVKQIIKKEYFYFKGHQKIFQAIDELNEAQQGIDLVTVVKKLTENKAINDKLTPFYIASLVNKVASDSHIESHCRILAEYWMKRELAVLGDAIYKKGLDPSSDCFELTHWVENKILELRNFDEGKISTITDVFKEVVNQVNENLKGEKEMVGIGTGFAQYDAFTGGFQKGDLIIIAGESSQGKTAIALNMLNGACSKYGAKCGVYSLEMTNKQLVSRLIAQNIGISSKHLLYGKLSYDESAIMHKDSINLLKSQIFFDDSSDSKIDTICDSIRNLKLKYDIDIAFVDFLQLINCDTRGMNREQQVGYMSRKLKNVARELEMTVVLLSQLNKDKDKPKPTMGRLRDSGQIAEASDQIIFIYRPEFYKIPMFDGKFDGIPSANAGLMILEKGRNVGIDEFLLSFNKELTLFTDYSNYSNDNTTYDSNTSPLLRQGQQTDISNLPDF